MSLRANSPSRRSAGALSSLLGLFLLCAALGCSSAPPVRSDGLPLVPRYTNTIQLDWMLASYRQAADKAGPYAERAADLARQAADKATDAVKKATDRKKD